MRERLPLDAISALFHADLVLTAYIDPGEVRSRVIGGGLELAVAPSGEERNKDVDDVEHWGYQTGAAVMTILANVLQACLDAENERDIMQEVRGGFYLGMQTPDVRRALLHRLSNLLALQRASEMALPNPPLPRCLASRSALGSRRSSAFSLRMS